MTIILIRNTLWEVCLDTQNPLQNHLQKGLKHKRDIREYQQNHTNNSGKKKEELQPFAQKILPKGKELVRNTTEYL